MACDISSILADFNKIMDDSIKGNAASITQMEDGNFQIAWGEQYNVKDKNQAVHMAGQKIETATKRVDEAGYSRAFGPFLEADTSGDQYIYIKKIAPVRLIRALELRNQAEDQGVSIEEIMTDEDRNLIAPQVDNFDNITKFEQLDPSKIIPEALKHADEIKNDIYKGMFIASPEEFLKFLAEQYWSTFMGAEIDSGIVLGGMGADFFPDSIMTAARKLYPKSLFIQKDNLPPIIPTC